VTQPLFHVMLLKVGFLFVCLFFEGFFFLSDGDVSMFGDCNHRWIEMICSRSAASEQAQLEADSVDASQELSHLV